MAGSPRLLRFDDQGRIDEDLRCCDCGYNLRNLSVQDGCPECGTGTVGSIRPDLLQFLDVQYVSRLRTGVTFFLAALTFFGIGALAFAVLSVSDISFPWGRFYVWAGEPSRLSASVGAWLISSPSLFLSRTKVERFLRWLVVISMVAILTVAVVKMVSTPLAGSWTTLMRVGYLFDVVWLGIAVLISIQVFRVARRIPDDRWVRHMKIIAVVMIVTCLVSVAGNLSSTYLIPMFRKTASKWLVPFFLVVNGALIFSILCSMWLGMSLRSELAMIVKQMKEVNDADR
jgi:hypothetical protein